MYSLTDEEILLAETCLHKLVGCKLCEMFRYMGIQKFEFWSPQVSVDDDCDYGLAVSCDWSIKNLSGGVLCSAEFGPVRHDDPENQIYKIIFGEHPTVAGLKLDRQGNLLLHLSSQLEFSINPNEPQEGSDSVHEQWRLMYHGDLEDYNAQLTLYGAELEPPDSLKYFQ